VTPPRVMVRVCGLSAVLTVCAAVGYALLPDVAFSTRSTSWWLLPVIAVAYGLAERTVFHFEFRREAI